MFSGKSSKLLWRVSVGIMATLLLLLAGFLFQFRDSSSAAWQAHQGRVLTLAFSQDGDLLFSGGDDGAIKAWNVADRKEAFALRGHKGSVTSVFPMRDKRHLLSTGEDGQILLWDLDKRGVEKKAVIHDRRLLCMAVSPREELAAVATSHNEVDFASLKNMTHFKGIDDMTWRADFGQTIAFVTETELICTDSRDVYKVAIGNRQEVSKKVLCRTERVVYTLALCPDSRTLVTGDMARFVSFWDIKNGTELGRVPMHKSPVNIVVVSPDGKAVASTEFIEGGLFYQEIGIVGVKKMKHLATLCGHRGLVLALAFSPKGGILASGSADHTIKLWNVGNLTGGE